MADTALSALATFTPILTDRVYGVDDPAGSPISGGVTFAAARTLIEANLQTPVIATSVTFDGVTVTGLSGSDTTILTGTAGTAGDLAVWNANGDVVDGPTPPSGAIVGTTDTQTLSDKTLTAPVLTGNIDVGGGTITGDTNEDILITPNGTGAIILDGLEWPTADGTENQVLKTNGLGVLSWVDQGGGVDWSTPVDADIIPDADGTRDLGSAANRFAEIHADAIYIGATQLNASALADPDADSILIWDDSAGASAWGALSDGLSISGTTISVDMSTVTYGVNAQTGTTYTLAIGDQGGIVTMSNASANTLTIPTNASVAFPTGTIVEVVMLGTGTTTVAGATGVTVNGVSAGSGDLSAQYGAVRLLKIGTDTWVASGAIGAVS